MRLELKGRINELKDHFQNILEKWKEALKMPETEINRDATILRFELAFEVGWKLIQVLAREEGYEVNSPRQAFQQAFVMNWVTEEVIWVDILKARNTATHVYREKYAKALYRD
jgi:nucleotidyltransferase substrate binding protein (TIGR01987 family)